MSDPTTPDRPATKAERLAKRMANLRPAKRGEVRNPTGKNGRTRSELIAAFLEKADDTELGRNMAKKLGLPADSPRIVVVLQRLYTMGLGKSEPALKTLAEFFGGKPRQQVDLSSEDGSMSPLGRDSLGDALRAAIEEKRRAAAAEKQVQEPPADACAGPK